MAIVPFNNEDLKALKLAFIENSAALLFTLVSFSACLIWTLYLVFVKKEYTEFWQNIIWIVPLVILTNTLRGISEYAIDYIRKEKVVITSKCKKITDTGEFVTYYLIIEGYGRIALSGYNYEFYYSLFTEEFEEYEIHWATKSTVILYAKKLSSA